MRSERSDVMHVHKLTCLDIRSGYSDGSTVLDDVSSRRDFIEGNLMTDWYRAEGLN
ncbi:MAG: hypothetical protein PWR28_1739 [Synergistaceae bacterium]|nr:hypothetical protein [Synergistaceae bacterium]